MVRSYELGVNSFIVKPVTFAGLVDVMRGFSTYWFEIVELPARMRPGGHAPAELVNVLIVDDDEDDFIIARDLLGEQEYTRVRGRVGVGASIRRCG